MFGMFEESCSVVARPRDMLDTDRFWRLENPVIHEEPKTGNKILIRGGMLPPQRRWWLLKNFIKVLVGGYGSGKTLVGCKRAISLALQNAPVPVGVVSPTFPLARSTVIPTISALLSGKRSIYGKEFYWTYRKQSHEFRFRYRGRDATIMIYSGDDPLSLRGPNLAAGLIDEPFIQDVEVFRQIIARIRHPDATHRELLLTGTPEQLNWGYDLCMGEMNDRFDVGVVTASTRDNIALQGDYVKRLEGAFDGKAADAFIEGKFVNLSSGLVYYAFDPELNVRALEIPKEAELGVGMDFNVNPMAFVVFWRAGDHIHVFDEQELPNADTEYACSWLKDNYVTEKVRRTEQVLNAIYPDASGRARKTAAPEGKSDFWYIEDAGFEVCANDSNPKRKDRFNAVNGKLKPKVGGTSLTVSPKCRKLIKYLSTHSHEMMNKQKRMTHLLDAFGYPVAYLFPIDKDFVRIEKLSGV